MKWRFFLLYGFLFVAFGILFSRLSYLTLVRGDYYRGVADEQRVRLQKIVAARGIIFDRNGKPLVRNIPVFKKCPTGNIATLENVKCDVISRDEALRLESQDKLEGLVVEVGREYLYSEETAHLLGYLGEVTAEEVKSGHGEIGQMVGRTGIEEEYEPFLRGKNGAELVEADTMGVNLRKIGKKEPIAGQDIFLSIDINLQKAAFEALGGKKGAVIASDPRTGQIFALVSSPSYDPNILTRADVADSQKIGEIFTDTNKPLFNRAIGGAYPPGSTFKLVTSIAGLEEGKITKETKIEDTGQIVIGQYKFANWYFTKAGGVEGQINVIRALARSTDTFYYKVGEFVGAETLIGWAKKFGLGRITGLDLPGEVPGFLPKPEAGNWYLGNTYHISIGQGDMGLTPLQVNRMTAVVANRGRVCNLKLKISDQDNNLACEEILIKKESFDTVTEGMRQACSPGGTAGVLFNFNPSVACKTGTAEFDNPKGDTHAWLTAFAPIEKPEIVVTALVEAGGEGSTVAAPIAKRVLEEYFKN